MTRKSLWPACVKSHPFQQQLNAARQAGYSHLPIGLATYQALRSDGLNDRDIVSLYDDHGLAPGHFDGFSAWAPIPFNDDLADAAKAVFDSTTDQCLTICNALGIDKICATGTFRPQQFAINQLQDGFHAFAEAAQEYNIQVDLEFLPFWGIPDLATATQILGEQRPDNAGILLDTWHFLRGNPDFDLLRSLPAGTIRTLQLADASLQPQDPDMFIDCLVYRKPPGEGELPIHDVVRALKAQDIDDVGPEIFSSELDNLSAAAAAQRCFDATQRTGLWS